MRFGAPNLAEQFGARLDRTPLRKVPRSSEALIPDAPVLDPADLGPVAWPEQRPKPDEERLKRYAQNLFAQRAGRQRRYKETVEASDDVVVSCLGFSGGAPVPFTARHETLLFPTDERIPGAHNAAVGQAVGSSLVYRLALDADADGETTGGQTLKMALEIVEAWQRPSLSFEDAAVADAAVKATGCFASLDDLLAQARQQWRAEEKVAHRLAERNAVLAAARARHPIVVDDSAVDGLLHVMWAQAEGEVLARMNVTPDEQSALLQAWQSSDELREEARKRLWTSALVRAFGRSRKVEPTSRQAGAQALSGVPAAPQEYLAERAIGAALLAVPQEGPREAIFYLASIDRLVDEVKASGRPSE